MNFLIRLIILDGPLPRWVKFFNQILSHKREILIALDERISKVVVVLAVDGWWERISGSKLLVAKDIVVFFRQAKVLKAIKTTWGFLKRRREVFLWWSGDLRWPELGGLRRERIADERRESLRGFPRCGRKHGSLVHLELLNRWITSELILRQWLVWSITWFDGPDWQIFALVW